MAVDLHTHSTASDGTDPPSVVVERAVAAGLYALALTDHDTLSGIEEARRAASVVSIEFVSGVELSVEWPTGSMHMLVYFLEPGDGPLQDRLTELRAGRDERNVAIVERVRRAGFPITMDDVLRHAAGDSVGRPHIADALVEQGAFPDRDAAFASLLANGRPAYVPRPRLGAFEAIDLAGASGALTSIAHPYTIGLNRNEYRETFRILAEAGLTGIEAYHTEHTPELREHLTHLATDLGLVATGGSDYHGTGKPGVHVGTGKGDLHVPDSAFDQLRSRLR